MASSTPNPFFKDLDALRISLILASPDICPQPVRRLVNSNHPVKEQDVWFLSDASMPADAADIALIAMEETSRAAAANISGRTRKRQKQEAKPQDMRSRVRSVMSLEYVTAAVNSNNVLQFGAAGTTATVSETRKRKATSPADTTDDDAMDTAQPVADDNAMDVDTVNVLETPTQGFLKPGQSKRVWRYAVLSVPAWTFDEYKDYETANAASTEPGIEAGNGFLLFVNDQVNKEVVSNPFSFVDWPHIKAAEAKKLHDWATAQGAGNLDPGCSPMYYKIAIRLGEMRARAQRLMQSGDTQQEPNKGAETNKQQRKSKVEFEKGRANISFKLAIERVEAAQTAAADRKSEEEQGEENTSVYDELAFERAEAARTAATDRAQAVSADHGTSAFNTAWAKSDVEGRAMFLADDAVFVGERLIKAAEAAAFKKIAAAREAVSEPAFRNPDAQAAEETAQQKVGAAQEAILEAEASWKDAEAAEKAAVVAGATRNKLKAAKIADLRAQANCAKTEASGETIEDVFAGWDSVGAALEAWERDQAASETTNAAQYSPDKNAQSHYEKLEAAQKAAFERDRAAWEAAHKKSWEKEERRGEGRITPRYDLVREGDEEQYAREVAVQRAEIAWYKAEEVWDLTKKAKELREEAIEKPLEVVDDVGSEGYVADSEAAETDLDGEAAQAGVKRAEASRHMAEAAIDRKEEGLRRAAADFERAETRLQKCEDVWEVVLQDAEAGRERAFQEANTHLEPVDEAAGEAGGYEQA